MHNAKSFFNQALNYGIWLTVQLTLLRTMNPQRLLCLTQSLFNFLILNIYVDH